MENFIRAISYNATNAFNNIATHGCKQILRFEIDIDWLNPKYAKDTNITAEGDFVEIIKELQIYNKLPALYLFEINKQITYDEIINIINNTRNDNLNFPALNSNKRNNGVLYIGKVKSCAWGRFIQHLGYHKNKKSHGLHIDFWAKEIKKPLMLTYTVMFFEEEMADYIEILEKVLARNEEFKPIIGKH